MESMLEYRRRLAERDLAYAWPQWRIVRLLGTGSFGEVYEIHREEYGRTSRSALKIIRKEKPAPLPGDAYTNISRGNNSEEFIASVLKEIDIMERLKGAPNIVVIDDYTVVRSQDSNAVLIRMELLTNLGEFMTTRQISMNDILRIGIDTCNALEYCEHQNIIHRDVKESNIFYSEMGYFKLGDFGISRQLNDYLMNSGTLTSAGTVSKMAPEVFNGQKYDHRVDIYSLGIVLYSLLNYGRPPFYPPYPEAVSSEAAGRADMIRMRGTAIPALPGVDAKLNKIICKACNPHPSGRYKNAKEFRDALEEYYDQINNAVAGITKEVQGIKPTKALTGVLVACVAVIIGSVSIWFGIRSMEGSQNTNPPRYIAEETESQSGNAEEDFQPKEDSTGNNDVSSDENEGGAVTDGEKPEENQPDEEEESEDEAEDSGNDTYAGSSYSIKDQQSGGKAKSNDDESDDEGGTIYLRTEKGRRAIKIDTPDWGSKEYKSSNSVVFRSGGHSLWISYFSDASYSPDFSMNIERSYYAGDPEVIHVESLSEVSTDSVGDYDVSWFSTSYRYLNDDGSYNRYCVLYKGSISVQEGILEFEDQIISDDDYADFDESDFFDDLSHWSELE